MSSQILTPALALITWSVVILVWLYITRVPALKKVGKKLKFLSSFDLPLSKTSPKGKEVQELLPDEVKQVADNYNHLMEQPTIFYALLFYLHGRGDYVELQVQLAWAYVALRVLHSLIQCTKLHTVPVRFAVFLTSSLVLIAMVLIAVWAEVRLN